MSAAVMAAVSWVTLTKVVARGAPFHCTVLSRTKPLPVAVSVKAAPPAVAVVGDTDVSVGTGLLIENVCAADVPPPGVGVTTLTTALPAAAMSAAVMAAVSWVVLTNVVARGAPFHCTVLPGTKLLPIAVSVKAAPPAAALVGDTDVSVGAGLLPATPVPVTVREMLLPLDVNVTSVVATAATTGVNRMVTVAIAPAP